MQEVMQMQTGTITHGFRINQIRELKELRAELWEMEHERTGAQLCWLKEPEENKAFSIAFRTIPEDSTGVFHILEHSVLCGSDKYPVKKPFVELLKTSMQTFLNAMTFPDKTVYPVSSRNDRDFLNLMDVYLDAVFHPAIYHTPEIFMQEGWHYELSGGGPAYQGVVLNEMKGNFGVPRTVLENAMNRVLFPDVCYRHVYGGDPAHIPDLSYKQFLVAHRTFYHPSNARISLVGSIHLDEVLEKLDQVLSPYARRDVVFPIPVQAPIPAKVCEVPYEIGQDEPEDRRTVISFGKLLGLYDNRKRSCAASILADYLAGDREAVLKKAILDAGLGQDVIMRIHDGTQQTWISFEIWNTDRECLQEIRDIVHKTVAELSRTGFDPDRLQACYNRFAFRMRDWDGGWYPRSIRLALGMLDTWLYGGDPADGILAEDTLKAVESQLDKAYFLELLQDLFLDDNDASVVALVPSRSFGKERKAQEKERLKAEEGSWSQERKNRFLTQSEAFVLWQQAPDTEEAAASIPALKLSDLKEKPEMLSFRAGEVDGTTVLYHPTKDGLTRFNLYFDASDLSFDELPSLAILAEILGTMETKHHSKEELQLLIKKHIGSLEIRSIVLPGRDAEHCRIQLKMAVTSLPEQAAAAGALLTEMMTETVFADSGSLRDTLRKKAMEAQMAVSANGHQFAVYRVAAGQTASGAARERLSGTSYVQWLKIQSEAGDETLDELLDQLSRLAKKLFCTGRLTVSCAEKMSDILIRMIVSEIPSSEAKPMEACIKPIGSHREGIVVPTAVGYAAKGADLQKIGIPWMGSLPVLANVLNYEYLWPQIRVRGGAYGCGFICPDSGELCFYSYRDPHPGRSLAVMDRAERFLRAFCDEKQDLSRFVLGSVSELDPLLTDAQKMNTAESRYFRGITENDIFNRYQQLLHTTPDDLRELGKLLEAIAGGENACVVAGEPLIDACGTMIEKRIYV